MHKMEMQLLHAFPAYLLDDVQKVISAVPLKSDLTCPTYFVVNTCDDVVRIPERVYYDEPELLYVEGLSPTQKVILHCIFTRHYNGYVREKNLRLILPLCDHYPCVLPYVFRLMGEYVIEILQVIKDNLDHVDIDHFQVFVAQNPAFYKLIRQQMASYWNCYYRSMFPKREDYVGYQILRYLR